MIARQATRSSRQTFSIGKASTQCEWPREEGRVAIEKKTTDIVTRLLMLHPLDVFWCKWSNYAAKSMTGSCWMSKLSSCPRNTVNSRRYVLKRHVYEATDNWLGCFIYKGNDKDDPGGILLSRQHTQHGSQAWIDWYFEDSNGRKGTTFGTLLYECVDADTILDLCRSGTCTCHPYPCTDSWEWRKDQRGSRHSSRVASRDLWFNGKAWKDRFHPWANAIVLGQAWLCTHPNHFKKDQHPIFPRQRKRGKKRTWENDGTPI